MTGLKTSAFRPSGLSLIFDGETDAAFKPKRRGAYTENQPMTESSVAQAFHGARRGIRRHLHRQREHFGAYKSRDGEPALDAGWSLLQTMLQCKSDCGDIWFKEVDEEYSTQVNAAHLSSTVNRAST
jgi:hypothetical protein